LYALSAAGNPAASDSAAVARAEARFAPKPMASVIVWLPGFPLSAVRAPCTTLPGSVAS
jgi:hypothetical protein